MVFRTRRGGGDCVRLLPSFHRIAIFSLSVLTFLIVLLFSPAKASAYSVGYVSNLSSVDAGTVFLTNISNSNMTYTCSANFAKLSSPRSHPDVGYTAVSDFYAKPTISANATLGSTAAPCITARWTRAGYTTSGEPVDLELSIQQITFPKYSINTTNNRMLLVYAGNLIGLGSGGPSSAGADGYGVNMLCKISLYKSGTSNLVKQKAQFAVKDLDVMGYGSSFANEYAESIELVSGFDSQTYVQSNTLLNKSVLSSSGGSMYRGTAGDSNTWRSGFAAFFSGGTASFRYRACNYAATIILGSYTSYPTWSAPTKTVNNAASSAVIADCYNDTVSFQHNQYVPYTASTNAASSISFSDTLDSAFDMPFTTVKVFRNGIDNTSSWKVSKNGRTVTATALSPAATSGSYSMIISTRLRPECDLSSYQRNGTRYRIPNTSSTTINGSTKSSNTVYAEVSPYAFLSGRLSPTVPDFVEGNDSYSLSGAEYAVYGDEACTQLVCSFATKPDGTYSLTQQLPFSTYYVKQLSPSKGYRVDANAYKLDISFSSTSVTDRKRTVHKELYAAPQSGFIEIVQRHSKSSDLSAASGIHYQLGEACYQISSSTSYVSTVKTAESGSSPEVEVPLGRSLVSIVSPPSGYLRTSYIEDETGESLQEQTDEVDISSDGQRVQIIRSNVPVKGRISVHFKNASSQSKLDYAGLRIGLFADEDIYDNEGNVVFPAGDMVQDHVLQSGEESFTSDEMYLGKYSACILSIPPHLLSDTESFPCLLQYEDDRTPIVSSDVDFLISPKIEMPETGSPGSLVSTGIALFFIIAALSSLVVGKPRRRVR